MTNGNRPLHDALARFIDNEAFAAKRIGKARQHIMAVRRRSASLRAKAAIRFFVNHPEHLQRLNAAAEAKHG